MFAIHDSRFRDILLLILGVFGALWFFSDLGNHHPLSSLDLKMEERVAIQKADSIFYSWEYQPVSLKKRVRVESYSGLINNLQSKYGRNKFFAGSGIENDKGLPFFTWVVDEFSVQESEIENAFTFRLSEEGEVVEFSISNELINSQTPFSRKMIKGMFGGARNYNKVKEDSIITMLVDFQHLRSTGYELFTSPIINPEGTGFSDSLTWKGVDYYIENSYWNRFTFSRDSLEYNDDGELRYVKAILSTDSEIMGISPKLEIEMLPAGVLRKMEVDLGGFGQDGQEMSRIKANLLLGIIFIFIVWLLISFYLRIKVRAIDTRPALIVAIITGFFVPLLLVLQLAKALSLSFETEEISTFFNQVLFFGVAGAFTSISFFVATAVSDSVTRQYWPEQLRTWDLVRQGMFKNKPIGWAIIRAICIGAITSGVYVLLINVFPNLYVSGDVFFIADEYALPPLANILITVLLGLAVVVLTFLVVGNQVYSFTTKKWIIPFVSAVIFGMIDPFSLLRLSPEIDEFAINAIIGFLFGLFYIRFDFVTIALGFFFYLNFVQTSTGWLVSNSPDFPIFLGFILTLIVLAGVGFYFILVGEETEKLPDYIPEYIEDLAKEQRVQQELDIARNVQKTFLPNTTPTVKGFDTAAICIPAHETGGDYYDIICLEDNKAAIAIGDVSGKGIQAAFYMTFAKGVLHSLCEIFPSPKMLMYRANKLFNDSATRGTFISMIYGILDSKKKTFTYLRAGHNPILYKKNDGSVSWLQPKGVVLGMTKGEMFNRVSEEETIELDAGDVLILYTDGITEAQNNSGDFYDEARLMKLIKREKTTSAKELRNLIIEDVRTFIAGARQYDDMTLVVIKV
ncbi:MAG: PP2C family protein-serine/threonine phosphatase [Balneolales bacterium]|nr:PP2C family protein-serine/threonine phosphatase [Balneolales bacterium]